MSEELLKIEMANLLIITINNYYQSPKVIYLCQN